jgi:hypothetical protein
MTKAPLVTLFIIYWLAGHSVPAVAVDIKAMERVEDYSEELANQLHRLSVDLLEQNTEEIARHYSPALVANGWPQYAESLVPYFRWIESRQTVAGSTPMDKAAFLSAWTDLLSSFTALEDVRFKVKQAHFHEEQTIRTDADLFFFIVGRHTNGQRRTLEATAHIKAVRDQDGHWLIEQFTVKHFEDRSVTLDLFSEISVPAGVYRALPRFGAPGNERFSAPGVAVHDVDQDGLVDLFVTGADDNKLYINQGDGTFEDQAGPTGLQITPPATGPLFVDYDNDGDHDLFLAACGQQMLFENRLVPDGRLEFFDISLETHVDHAAQGYSAQSADVNNDGYPDIYVASYNQYGLIMPNSWFRATNGTPNLLFINQGDGTFLEAAQAWQVQDRRWSYAAQFADIDRDGRIDLYVANDFGENALYLNDGTQFHDQAAERGALDPGNGMGVSFGDVDNDGLLDIHVSNMSSTAGKRILQRLFPDQAAQPDQASTLYKLASGNTLLRNQGDGTFQDITSDMGPLTAGWAFGGGFVDFDNDGWEDIHSPNGFISGKSLKDT